MKESLRAKLRLINNRLDALDNHGLAFCVINHGEDEDAKIAKVRAANPGKKLHIIRVKYVSREEETGNLVEVVRT